MFVQIQEYCNKLADSFGQKFQYPSFFAADLEDSSVSLSSPCPASLFTIGPSIAQMCDLSVVKNSSGMKHSSFHEIQDEIYHTNVHPWLCYFFASQTLVKITCPDIIPNNEVEGPCYTGIIFGGVS